MLFFKKHLGKSEKEYLFMTNFFAKPLGNPTLAVFS